MRNIIFSGLAENNATAQILYRTTPHLSETDARVLDFFFHHHLHCLERMQTGSYEYLTLINSQGLATTMCLLDTAFGGSVHLLRP